MQTLRASRTIARFVLVWFALALGAAIASPLVKPRAMELICSASGAVMLMPAGDDGSPTPAALDCPLCVPCGALPPSAHAWAEPLPWTAAVPCPAARPCASRSSAVPPPARGPPAIS